MILKAPNLIPGDPTVVNCDYCGSAETKPFSVPLMFDGGEEEFPEAYRKMRYQFFCCVGCGLVYLPKRPNPRDLPALYPADYKCFQSYNDRGFIMRKLASSLAHAKLRQIRSMLPAGNTRLLDYGCGSGTWLEGLRKIGSDLEMIGMDVVPHAVEQAKKKGFQAYCCNEADIFEYIRPGSIGVIHLFHVIEHLPSPRQSLLQMRKALAPGGVVIGQTPNVNSIGRRFWGELWNQWQIPHHFILFSPETLRRHAEAADFQVIDISSSLSSATQWAQSFLRWWTRKMKRPFRETREPFYPFLILFFLPLILIESIFSKTCHIDFVLKRDN